MSALGGFTAAETHALRALRDVGVIRITVATQKGYTPLWQRGLVRNRLNPNGKWADMVLTKAGKRVAARLLPLRSTGGASVRIPVIPLTDHRSPPTSDVRPSSPPIGDGCSILGAVA